VVDSENDLLHELHDHFLDQWPMAVWRKLHGDRFQAGVPDLVVALERSAALVEAKWIRSQVDAERPLAELVTKTLTGIQWAELSLLAAIDGPLRARYLVGTTVESDDLPGGAATLAVGIDLAHLSRLGQLSLTDVAGRALLLRRPDNPMTLMHWPLQFHIRCRGERWHAGHVVLGVETWGRVDAAKLED